MKTKSLLLFTLLSVLFYTALLISCKRGADDPFISLRSRNSRIKGTWILKSVNYRFSVLSGYSSPGNSYTSNTTVSYDGSIRITKNSSSDKWGSSIKYHSSATEEKYELKITVKEDYTTSWKGSSSLLSSCSDTLSSCTLKPPASSDSKTLTGNDYWAWINSNDDKVGINSITPYFHGYLRKLSNSEMIIETKTESITESSSQPSNHSSSETIVFVKE